MRDYQFIGYLLNSTTAISSITSTRIYHGDRPENTKLSDMPCINYYQLPGGSRISGMESRTFSINCRASDPAVARRLGDLVIDLFGGTSGTGTFGYASSFTAARASIVRDNGLLSEQSAKDFLVPIDVLIVYSVDTVS